MQTDANGRVTAWTYDPFGHQTSRTLPAVSGQAAATETMQYDDSGRLSTHTDFNGQEAVSHYDSRSRLSSMEYFAVGSTTADETMSYTYDSYNRRSTVVDTTVSGSRETDYGYDADGRLTLIVSPEGTLHYGYDAEGRHTRTWTDYSDIRYGYDALSRLVNVTEVERNGVVLGTPATTTYHYGADGTLQSQTLSNGVTTSYAYDFMYRVLTQTEKDSSGSLLASYYYTRNADGYIATVTERVRQPDGTMASDTEVYTYDALDRLIEEKYTNSLASQTDTTDYTLDLVGNRLAKQTTHADGSVDRTASSYNERDELTSETTKHNGTLVETTTFGYDANGSLTTQTSSTGDSTAYAYDVKGLLAGATVRKTAGGILAVEQTRYAYDPDGIRVREETTTTMGSGTPSTAVKLLVVDGNNPTGYAQVVEERTAAGALIASFVHGLAPISQFRGGVTSDYLMDAHSGVRQLVDAAAAVLAAYRYDAFGGVAAQAGGIENPLLYRGERWDVVLEQYYLRARMYNPASGAFTSMDSFAGVLTNPGTLPRYFYAGANPSNALDPTGKEFSLGGFGSLLGSVGVQLARFSVFITPYVFTLWKASGITLAAYGLAGVYLYALTGQTYPEIEQGLLVAGSIFLASSVLLEELWFVNDQYSWIQSVRSGSGKRPGDVIDFSSRNTPVVPNSDIAQNAEKLYATGGQLYIQNDRDHLRKLANYLARRSVRLDVSPSVTRASFRALDDGTAVISVPPDVTNETVWHELGHFIHWRRVGPEQYRNLSRDFGNNVPEQFVFDLLERPARWNRLSPEYRELMVDYIENVYGGVGR